MSTFKNKKDTAMNLMDSIFGTNEQFVNENELFVEYNNVIISYLINDGYYIVIKKGENRKQITATGQRTRLSKLMDAVKYERTGQIRRLVKSLSTWEEEMVTLHFVTVNGLKVGDTFYKMETFRRTSFISRSFYKVVILVNEDSDIKELVNKYKNFWNLTTEEQQLLQRYNISDKISTNYVLGEVAKLVRKTYGTAYSLFGGNPSNSMLLFTTEDPDTLTAERKQQYAKVLLSQGDILDMPIEFKVVSIPTSHRDLLGLLNDETIELINDSTGYDHSRVFQVRINDNAQFAKGILSGEITREHNLLMDEHDHMNLIDVNQLKSIIGIDSKVGDIVTISNLLIMSTDEDCGNRPIKLAYQVLERASKDCTMPILEAFNNSINELKTTLRDNPLSLLSKFGLYDMFRRIGGKVGIQFGDKMDLQKNLQSNVEQRIKDIKRKGITIPGSYLFLLSSSSLGFDQCLISKEMKKYDVQIGDRVNFMTFPGLPGSDNFYYSKEVVGFIEEGVVILNPHAIDAALRDCDGDKLIVFVHEYINFPYQTRVDYNVKSGTKSNGIRQKTDEESIIKLYTQLNGEIGIIDSMIQSIMKYMDVSSDMLIELGKWYQGVIASVKHEVKHYNPLDWNKFAKDLCPALFNNGRTTQHPDLLWRKGKDIPIEELSTELSLIKEGLDSIVIPKINTISTEEFRILGAKLASNYSSFINDELRQLMSTVSSLIRSMPNDDIDLKNMLVRKLGRDVKKQIGSQRFYVLTIFMLVDDTTFMSDFWTIMFCSTDTQSMKDIIDQRVNVVTDKFEATKSYVVENTVQLFKRGHLMNSNEFPVGSKICISELIELGWEFEPSKTDKRLLIDSYYTITKIIKQFPRGILLEVKS